MPLLNVLKSFANSEKAVAVAIFAIIATVFVFVDKITVEQWMDYTQVLLGIYVGGKAIQGAAASVSGTKAAQAQTTAAKIELNKLKATIKKNDTAADDAAEGKD